MDILHALEEAQRDAAFANRARRELEAVDHAAFGLMGFAERFGVHERPAVLNALRELSDRHQRDHIKLRRFLRQSGMADILS